MEDLLYPDLPLLLFILQLEKIQIIQEQGRRLARLKLSHLRLQGLFNVFCLFSWKYLPNDLQCPKPFHVLQSIYREKTHRHELAKLRDSLFRRKVLPDPAAPRNKIFVEIYSANG